MVFSLSCLFIVPIDIQDGVNDLHASANESIFLFFVCRMTYMNAQRCYWMLIKMQISLLNLIYVQMFVLSRSWMSLRAIEGRFMQMIAYFLVMNSKGILKTFHSRLVFHVINVQVQCTVKHIIWFNFTDKYLVQSKVLLFDRCQCVYTCPRVGSLMVTWKYLSVKWFVSWWSSIRSVHRNAVLSGLSTTFQVAGKNF